MLEVTVYLKLD